MIKTRHYHPFGLLTILILIMYLMIALTGCQSTNKAAGKKLETEGFKLTYTDKAQAGSEIGAIALRHPSKITERQMMFHLVSLKYETFSLLGQAGPVFTKEDIQKMKRLLTKALNKANDRNIIGFEVDSEDGTTSGILFASQGKLHWRFDQIRGVKYSLTRNQMARYGTAWRMVPGKGQQFYVTDKLIGSKQWTNWIEANINLVAPSNLKTRRVKKKLPSSGVLSPPSPAPPPAPSIPQSSSPPPKDTGDLEEKLKFLKHLYENQLIDQQEYEQKRKDLLDKYL